jgi:phosphomannomutase/phosphoglucomutase
VLRFEAQTAEALARIQGDFRRELAKLAPDASLPF